MIQAFNSTANILLASLVIVLLPYIAAIIEGIVCFDFKDIKKKIKQRPEERWLGFLGGDLIRTYEDDFGPKKKR